MCTYIFEYETTQEKKRVSSFDHCKRIEINEQLLKKREIRTEAFDKILSLINNNTGHVLLY